MSQASASLSLEAQALSQKLGCKLLEISYAGAAPAPAVQGGSAKFAATFKSAGGMWNRNHKVYVFKDWSDVFHALQEAARREGLISVAPNHRDANPASLAARVRTVCEESHARIQKSIALRQTMKAAAQCGGDIRRRVG
jgi:hypothetical protein